MILALNEPVYNGHDPVQQVILLLVNVPSRYSSTCVIMRNMAHGMNLLPFLNELCSSAKRQVRDMSYLIYAKWKTNWLKTKAGSGSASG